MSIKRHIAILNSHLSHWQRLLENKICDIDEGKSTIEALKMAIKLLESEDDCIPISVLYKIRAEINSPNRGTCDYFIVDRIEEIIDKYIEGSKVTEE